MSRTTQPRLVKARAIGTEQKNARRSDILDVARRLLIEHERQLPSVAQICAAAGLAKGTVYLYFATKEEIFIALLAEEFDGLLQEVHAVFGCVDRSAALTGFIHRYVDYLEAHPELLRLDSMAYSVLENNLGEAQLRAFKLNLVNGLESAGKLVDRAFDLKQGQGITLLFRTYALTRGLWQALDYPPVVQALLREPVFAAIRREFRAELIETLLEYWQGALKK